MVDSNSERWTSGENLRNGGTGGFMVDLSVERLSALEMQKSTASLWVEHDQSEVRGARLVGVCCAMALYPGSCICDVS
jgi:hypothetical protein